MFTSYKPAAIQKTLLCMFSTSVLLASASIANADGYGFIKPNISQFGEPIEIRVKKVDGNMSLRHDSLSIPIQYEAGYKGTYSTLLAIELRIEHVSKGNGESFGLRRDLDLEGKDKVWGTLAVSLNRAQIEPMEKYAKEQCASHTGNRDKRIDTVIPLVMHVSYLDNQNIGHFTKSGLIPVAIVCEPNRPSNPAKLLLVKLHATPAHCGKPVALIANFAVTLPANYKFKLQRGDGESQDATIFPTMKDGPVYRGQWHKQYVFNASETRKYRLVSEKFEPLTDWVTISVQCPISQNTPRPNNVAVPQRPRTHAQPVNKRVPAAPRAPRHVRNLKK